MAKKLYKDEIDALSVDELVNEIERNRRDLQDRWTNGRLYGAGVRNTSKLEHRQVLCYDRLVDLILGVDMSDNPGLVKHMVKWAEKTRIRFNELQAKIG